MLSAWNKVSDPWEGDPYDTWTQEGVPIDHLRFWGGVRGLFHREFEETAAAKDVTFSIAEGEFVGFLGPNGAGKTTFVKTLLDFVHPTAGRVEILVDQRPDARRSLLVPAPDLLGGPPFLQVALGERPQGDVVEGGYHQVGAGCGQ